MTRQREEVLNVLLAQLIQNSGMSAAPETISTSSGERAMPDVIVTFRGLRCAIEGKIEDASGARDRVAEKARQRIETGVAHMAIAALYPSTLREEVFDRTRSVLRSAPLEFCIFSEAGEEGWRCGDLDAILADLRRSYRRLAADDVVDTSVGLLKTGMEDVVNVLMSEATSARLAELLGVYEEDG